MKVSWFAVFSGGTPKNGVTHFLLVGVDLNLISLFFAFWFFVFYSNDHLIDHYFLPSMIWIAKQIFDCIFRQKRVIFSHKESSFIQKFCVRVFMGTFWCYHRSIRILYLHRSFIDFFSSWMLIRPIYVALRNADEAISSQ